MRLFLFSLLSEQGRIDTNPGMKERIVPQKRSNKTPTTKARPTKRNGRAAKSAHAPGSTSSFTRVRPTTRKKGAFSRPAQARGSAHATPEGRFSPEVLLTRRNLLIGAGVKMCIRDSGYLTGSGLKDYEKTGAVCGIELPVGLVNSSRLPEPIFTPSTKAEIGDHDENISFDKTACLLYTS